MAMDRSFAEKLVLEHNLAVQAWTRAMELNHPGSITAKLYKIMQAKAENLIQALITPFAREVDPHGEEFADLRDQFAMAVLGGLCANPNFSDTSEDKIANYAEAQAAAYMKIREARKGGK